MGNPEGNSQDATIDFEKRFKDTQGAYTKSQQELKAAKARLEALEKLTTPKVELAPEVKEELEALKYEDPDAWRAKVNQLEQEAQRKHDEALSEAEKQAKLQAELESRTQMLSEFNVSHPDLVITDEVIQYDVPPRITKKLESGEISFASYLEEVADYLKSPKVIGDGNSTLNQPDLNRVGGGDKPSDTAVKGNIVKDYKNLVL